MKILVTGATGFIGSHLGKFFSPSDEVYALARSPSAVCWGGGRRVIQGDLITPETTFDELKKLRPEVCVHLAWQGIPDFGYDMSKSNLDQSIRLIHFLVEQCGCRKFVMAGSCFEYGKAFGACREDELVAANSYFSWAKHSLCDLGLMLAAKKGLSYSWLRFFYVYGPNQRSGSLIPTIAGALARGERPVVKTPHSANDFIYVDDVAQAVALAAQKDIQSGIYNVGMGRSVPVWKVCEALEIALGREPMWARELKASTVPASADFWADTKKMEAALGWKAKTSIEQGLEMFMSQFKREGTE